MRPLGLNSHKNITSPPPSIKCRAQRAKYGFFWPEKCRKGAQTTLNPNASTAKVEIPKSRWEKCIALTDFIKIEIPKIGDTPNDKYNQDNAFLH